MRVYAQRAQLDALPAGARVLDLGCGWGSLSLWLAEHYPHLEIVGFSNSHGQREFIENRARERGFHNLRIVTGNVATDPMPADALKGGFNRVISIEMFEHMRNYQLLLKISGVPLLEAEMARRKPGYAEYMRRTSMLVPWPPKAG